VQFWGKKIDALILFVLYEDYLFVYFTINFLMFFFGGFAVNVALRIISPRIIKIY
jgi:hypothetical protein